MMSKDLFHSLLNWVKTWWKGFRFCFGTVSSLAGSQICKKKIAFCSKIHREAGRSKDLTTHHAYISKAQASIISHIAFLKIFIDLQFHIYKKHFYILFL